MRKERHSKLIRHDAVKLTVNRVSVHYPIQLGLNLRNRGKVDSDHRSLVRRPRQSPDLLEMSRLKEVGAMSRIHYLNALASILGKRTEHLCKRLSLNRVLKKFGFLNR